MKNWKKVGSMVLALVMTMSVMLALAGTALAEDQVTLRFSWWGGDARHEATLAVIAAFEAENPNIKIEPEYSSYDGYSEKKTTEFASKTAPDIFQIETGLGPEYSAQGVLYNLSETAMDFSLFDANFLVRNGQFGTGSQYAIPTGMAGSAMIVNKTLADEIGIDFNQPYNWEQLIEWGKQVQAYNKECYLLSANTSYAMPFFVRAFARQINGKPIIDDASMTLNMTEEQFVQCFTLVSQLYTTGTAAPADYKAPFGDQDQEDPKWIDGQYVASIGYTSNADVMAAANPNVEYMAGDMPLLENRLSDGWVNDCPQYIGVYANSQHPEEAAKFLDFFFNSDQAASLLGTVRSVPPTAKAQEIAANEDKLNPLTKDCVETSLQYNGESDSGHTTGSEVTAILKDAYENVSYGTKTPEEAAKDVVAQIEDYLEFNK